MQRGILGRWRLLQSGGDANLIRVEATLSSPHVAAHGCVLVVRGYFNPAILSPDWLLRVALISGEQHDDSEIQIISEEITIFRCGWATIQVGRDHLQVGASDPEEFDRLRDLVVGILQTLRHTPLAAIGINRHAHLRAPNLQAWHAVGDLLSPKDLWDGVLVLPGMQSIAYQGVRPDSFAGQVQVQIEPSNRVVNAIYVAHNDHFALQHVDRQPQSRLEFGGEPPAVEPSSENFALVDEILGKSWAEAMRRADLAVSRAWSIVEQAARSVG